jgi:hypothetical protein
VASHSVSASFLIFGLGMFAFGQQPAPNVTLEFRSLIEKCSISAATPAEASRFADRMASATQRDVADALPAMVTATLAGKDDFQDVWRDGAHRRCSPDRQPSLDGEAHAGYRQPADRAE